MRASRFEFKYRFWIFAAVIWCGFALDRFDDRFTAGTLARLAGWNNRSGIRTVLLLASAIMFAGAWCRTWATAYLQRQVVHDLSVHSDQLIADGPYRHVRNPLYLGLILLGIGLAFLASLSGALFIVVFLWIFVRRLIAREESELAAVQGELFEEFKQSVPRLIPSMFPQVPASGRKPRWPQAIFAESFVWAFGVATLIFAFTFNLWQLYALIGGALAIYGAGQVIRLVTGRKAQSG